MNDNKNPNPPKPFPWAAYIGILGQIVKFCRVDEKDEVQHGEGRVEAIFIAPDRRPQLRVVSGVRADGKPQVYNVDFAGLEVPPMETPATPPASDQLKYAQHIKAVRDTATAANEKIQELGKEANAHIETLNAEYMGDVIPA